MSSEFEECEWSPLSVSGSEGEIKFTITSGAGVHFSGNLEVPSGCIHDPVEFMAKSAILKFTLPEAPWDASVEWGVNAFYSVSGLEINADYGWLSVETWARQDPTGGTYPTCTGGYAESFGHDNNFGIGNDELEIEDSISHYQDYHGAFPIRKGQQPSLYIGCSIGLWVENGSIELIGGEANYHSESQTGLYFIMSKLP